MHILASRLIRLSGPFLPLPWYQRAPIGLLTGTPVHVALEWPRTRSYGDLLVSVVDPVNWPYLTAITGSTEDSPSVLADVYRVFSPLSIVYGEVATLDSRSRHEATLIVEPFHPGPERSRQDVSNEVESQVTRILSALETMGFKDTRASRLHADPPTLAWLEAGVVSLGWVQVRGWRDALEAQGSPTTEHEYDLNAAVVSADTGRRLLRYTIPRRGAVSVRVEHADRPGAVEQIAQAVRSEDLNVLSSLLRRGSAPPTKAEVVLIVEPGSGDRAPSEVAEVLRRTLHELPAELRARAMVSDAVDAEAVLYPRRPDEIVARPPKGLTEEIHAITARLPHKAVPVFIPSAFLDSSEYSEEILLELRNCLSSRGCVSLEARPIPGSTRASSDEVQAKMWASKAAIVLIVSRPDERYFAESFAHICGFMQALGKPILPLVQSDVAARVLGIANTQGLQIGTFLRREALNRASRASLWSAVVPWLDAISQ